MGPRSKELVHQHWNFKEVFSRLLSYNKPNWILKNSDPSVRVGGDIYRTFGWTILSSSESVSSCTLCRQSEQCRKCWSPTHTCAHTHTHIDPPRVFFFLNDSPTHTHTREKVKSTSAYRQQTEDEGFNLLSVSLGLQHSFFPKDSVASAYRECTDNLFFSENFVSVPHFYLSAPLKGLSKQWEPRVWREKGTVCVSLMFPVGKSGSLYSFHNEPSSEEDLCEDKFPIQHLLA